MTVASVAVFESILYLYAALGVVFFVVTLGMVAAIRQASR